MSDNISQDIAIKGEGNIVVGKGDVIINPLPPAEARLRRDLSILLKNVENTWIKGVLEKSVHETALLELGMELRVEAVDNPWRMVMEHPDQSRETLPHGRKIKEVFYEANGLLLILGEPGSGKTTTLLQLARDLVADVDQEFTHSVPVILNLSTWTNKNQPLDDWLVAELNSKYRLPKKDGTNWLRGRRILPLLDGLDEVKAENRAVCVQKINRLVTDYGLQGVVVCSRLKEYANLNVRLAFYRAIYLQPLTGEQVDEYLDQAGDKLASLRVTLQRDAALKNMAQSPLILSIMSLAYQNTSAEALRNPTLATDKVRRQHLFDMYISRMFNRKAGTRSYDDEKTKQYLSWLAQNMQRHNQEVFLIEGLQPSWLRTRVWQWVYVFASRLIGGPIISAITWSRVGIIAGITLGFVDLLRFDWLRKHKEIRKPSTFWWTSVNILIVWLVIAILESLISLLLGVLSLTHLNSALGAGLIVGLIFGVRGSRQSLENDIQTVDALRWSWKKAVEGALIGWLIATLVFMLSEVLLASGMPMWLSTGLIGLPIGALFYGLRREIIETKSIPNQGIQLSMRNAVFGGLIIWLGFALGSVLADRGYALNDILYGVDWSSIPVAYLPSLLSSLIVDSINEALRGSLISSLIDVLIGGFRYTFLYGLIGDILADVVRHSYLDSTC